MSNHNSANVSLTEFLCVRPSITIYFPLPLSDSFLENSTTSYVKQMETKQSCTPCLCGSKPTSSSMVAAHGKVLKRRLKLGSVHPALFFSSNCNSFPSHLPLPPSHGKPIHPVQPAGDATHFIEDLMDAKGHNGPREVSQIQLLTSKISHICKEIHDIKSQRKPQTNISIQNYTSTGLVEEQTNPNYTRERDNNNSAKEDTGDEDGWGGTYSSHSTLCPHEPSNPYNPSHHAPFLPSPNPPPAESILEPPGDLSPSPASRIGTLSPSSLS